MVAVLCLDDLDLLGAVGLKGEVAPVGVELACAAKVRTRRTTSRLDPSVVSAIWASPLSG